MRRGVQPLVEQLRPDVAAVAAHGDVLRRAPPSLRVVVGEVRAVLHRFPGSHLLGPVLRHRIQLGDPGDRFQAQAGPQVVDLVQDGPGVLRSLFADVRRKNSGPLLPRLGVGRRDDE